MPLMNVGECLDCGKPVYVGGTLRGVREQLSWAPFDGRVALRLDVWHRRCSPVRDLIRTVWRLCHHRGEER